MNPPGAAAEPALSALHRRRLRDVWRSAGWPCRDTLEIELLAAGLLLRRIDEQGRETLHVSDLGVQALAGGLAHNRACRSAHEALVSRVGLEMQRAGRVVWRTLSLRAPLPGDDGRTRWALVMPDVFSIRYTTVEDHVEPIVHEIKVSRADLLSDLRHAEKGAAYAVLSSQCWYVLREGIGEPEELPDAYGVMLAGRDALRVVRPAPRRPMKLPFMVWMSLARSTAELSLGQATQGLLGEDADTVLPGGHAVAAAPSAVPWVNTGVALTRSAASG